MKSGQAFPPRSVRKWVIRGALAAVAAFTGWLGVSQSLAQVIVRDNPRLAYVLAPWDGRITAAFAASLAPPTAGSAQRDHADILARKALRQDPTAIAAISTLALDAQARGDQTEARRLFAYAETLSRRDLQTQLWLIESAVTQGDVGLALRHYDIALRTKTQSRDLLFPVLASASADPQVRAALVRTLATKPSWGEEFLAYAAARGPDPRTNAALLLEARHARFVPPRSADSFAIHALLDGGFLDEAWRHYAATHRGSDRRRSRDPNFVTPSDVATAFDWVPIESAGVSTSIQAAEGGGVFDFSAPASIGGPLLQQVEMLPPGNYQIDGHTIGIEQPTASQPYWSLVCRGNGRELGRVIVPNSAQADGRFSGRLSVPANCPVQTLTLFARASDGVAGVSGRIDRVQLVPAD